MSSELKAKLQEIITKSISNVICIDDDYIEPYADSGDLDKKAFSSQVHETFTKQLKCKTTFYPYTNEHKDWKEYLHNQDLLVIDWKLTEDPDAPDDPDDHKKPLEIIDNAVDRSIPFVCVFTSISDTDLSMLINQVKAFFSGYSGESVEEVANKAINVGIREPEARKIITELIYSSEKSKEYTEKMRELGVPLETDEKQFFDYSDYNEWNRLYCNWVCHLSSFSKHCLIPEETHKNSIIVDGTYIFFVTKRKDERYQPDQIIETIVNELTGEPRSIFNVLWIYYFNLLKESIYRKKILPLRIPADALKYHATTTITDEGEYEYFSTILGMVVDEIVECIVKGKSLKPDFVIVQELIEQGKDIEYEKVANDLMKLNAIMNINSELSMSSSHTLTMGDVFYIDVDSAGNKVDKYVICVSASCDCAHPKSFADDDYYDYSFLKGVKDDDTRYNNKENNPEKRMLSFVCEGEDDAYYVNWDNQIWGGHVSKGGNIVQKGETIKVVFGNRDYNLKYICSIKEKYAQRLANDSFSWGHRVGTVYAKRKSDPCFEAFSKFLYSNDNGLTYADGIKELSTGNMVYVKVIFKVSSNNYFETFLNAALSIPCPEANIQEVNFNDDRKYNLKEDSKKGITKIQFNVGALKDSAEQTCTLKFIPEAEDTATITLNVNNVSKSHGGQSTVVFVNKQPSGTETQDSISTNNQEFAAEPIVVAMDSSVPTQFSETAQETTNTQSDNKS